MVARLKIEVQYWGRAIGAAIRRRRLEISLTQDQVAERIGRDRNYISELENGHRISRLDMLARLAGALDMTLPEFIALIEKEHEKIKKAMRGGPKPD